jgi:hypothetical protein
LATARGRRAFNGSDNRDGTKDTAACATTGERGMMVVMGYGLCVCFGVYGETTKIWERAKSSMLPRAFRKTPT